MGKRLKWSDALRLREMLERAAQARATAAADESADVDLEERKRKGLIEATELPEDVQDEIKRILAD